MGNLVADAMLDRGKSQGMSVAIQNGGGLRASIDAGDVTQGEVITVLPFQNTLATFQLTGADIRKALENGLSQIEQGAGRFPQVSGLKYTFDKTKPAGSRLVSVEAKEGDAFVVLDDAKTYGVVTNNFMRAGGDGYSIFETAGKNAYDFGPDLADVTAEYLAAHSPYKPYTDGRVTEVAASSTQAAATTAPAQAAPASPAAPAASTAPTAAAPAALAPNTPTNHVIAAGDTLWDLSKQFYGEGALWKKISDANGTPAPRHLTIGKELQIPSK
jgi:5'-nucleotidase